MNFNISWWCVVWPCWSVRIYVDGYFHFLSRSGLRSHIHSLFAVTKEGSTDFIIPYHSVESCHSYCRLFSPYSDCDVVMMSLCIPWYRGIFFHSESHAYNYLKWIRSERSLMAHAGHQRIVLRVFLQATGWTGIIWFIWKRSNWYGVDTVLLGCFSDLLFIITIVVCSLVDYVFWWIARIPDSVELCLHHLLLWNVCFV